MEQIMNQESAGSSFAQAQKKNKGMVAGMAICAILAVGGIGFGVYGMMQKSSSRPAEMRIEVRNEDGTTTTLETEKIEVSDDNKTVTITDTNISGKNPVISAQAPNVYALGFQSGILTNIFLSIGVKDGKVSSCTIISGNHMEGREKSQCTITGLSGNIYKVVEVGAGHDALNDIVAFIMEDGTMQYFPLKDIENKTAFSAKNVLNTGGFVVDAIDVGVSSTEGVGGYGAAVLVFKDGSFKEFDHSMLQ